MIHVCLLQNGTGSLTVPATLFLALTTHCRPSVMK